MKICVETRVLHRQACCAQRVQLSEPASCTAVGFQSCSWLFLRKIKMDVKEKNRVGTRCSRFSSTRRHFFDFLKKIQLLFISLQALLSELSLHFAADVVAASPLASLVASSCTSMRLRCCCLLTASDGQTWNYLHH